MRRLVMGFWYVVLMVGVFVGGSWGGFVLGSEVAGGQLGYDIGYFDACVSHAERGHDCGDQHVDWTHNASRAGSEVSEWP